MSRTYTLMGIFLIYTLMGISACQSTQTIPITNDCPPPPELIPITTEQQLSMDSQVLEAVIINRTRLIAYTNQLRVRANCED